MIRTEDEYLEACASFWPLMDASRGSEKGEELEHLIAEITRYEMHKYPRIFRQCKRHKRKSKFREKIYLAKCRYFFR